MYYIDFYYFDSGELKNGKIWELTIFTSRRVKLQEASRFAHDCCVLDQWVAIELTIVYRSIMSIDVRGELHTITVSMRRLVDKITD